MTTAPPNVTVSHPPFVVLRMVNPVLDRVMRSPVGDRLRRRYLTLSFKGRKSGQPYDFPIRAHTLDGDFYAVTSNRWRLNFRGGAPLRITHDGRTAEYQGTLVEDPAEVAEVLLKLTDHYGWKRAQHKLALKFTTEGSPTHEDFASVVEREKICAIHFTAA